LQFLQNNSSYWFFISSFVFFQNNSFYSSVTRLPLLDWDGHGGNVPCKIPPYRLLKKTPSSSPLHPRPVPRNFVVVVDWCVFLSRRLLTARSPAMAAMAATATEVPSCNVVGVALESSAAMAAVA
jgi:hypothetical protein